MIFGSSSFSFGARFPDISEGLTFTVNLVHDFFRLDFAAKILVFFKLKNATLTLQSKDNIWLTRNIWKLTFLIYKKWPEFYFLCQLVVDLRHSVALVDRFWTSRFLRLFDLLKFSHETFEKNSKIYRFFRVEEAAGDEILNESTIDLQVEC